jgi:predicted ATP-binding protein involved in virulence
LLNPEIVLLRQEPQTRERLERILKQILLLDRGGVVRTSRGGIELGGQWGTFPLSAMSDGYRSTTQWVLDFLGWQIFAEHLEADYMDGMLLIDELEQHLHPRWQRYTKSH